MSLFFRINNANSGYLTNSSLSRCQGIVAQARYLETLPCQPRRNRIVLTRIPTIVCGSDPSRHIEDRPAPHRSRSRTTPPLCQPCPRTTREAWRLPSPAIIHKGRPFGMSPSRGRARSNRSEKPMAINCPKCGAGFDVTLFQFGHGIRCDCGQWVELDRGHVIEEEPPADKPPPESSSGHSHPSGRLA